MVEESIKKQFRIPENIITPWLKALRSGEYKQGRSMLCTSDGGYCCLGVLATAVLHVENLGDSKYLYTDDFPSELRFEGMETLEGGLSEFRGGKRHLAGTLSRMNDGDNTSFIEPRTFDEIADWIEENVETY